MKKLFLFLLLALALHAEQTMKVVIDLTTGDLHTFESKILKGIVAHKTYYEGKLQELDVAVVIHGNAYKFFVKDPAHSPFKEDAVLLKASGDLAKRIAVLADTYDVTFLMCRSGMEKKKLETKDVYDFVTTVPNAAIGLIDKQNDGYAYLPVTD
jgi:intracellular sulfur oxidation DsrE/DsrF family protein